MFARVTTIQGAPKCVDDGIHFFREVTVPTVQGLEGFKGASLLVDRKSGKHVVITLWETDEAQHRSASAVNWLREQGAEVMSATRQPAIEVFELTAQV